MKLMTTHEVASALGLSTFTIRQMVRAGTFPVVRVTGKRAVRIDAADVETWVRQHTTVRASAGVTPHGQAVSGGAGGSASAQP